MRNPLILVTPVMLFISAVSLAQAGNEIMTDRCSAEVAIVPSYGDRPDASGTIILEREPNGSTAWTAPFQVRLGSDGHIRWWCHSTTGNWADVGTWRPELDPTKTFGCAVGGVVSIFEPGTGAKLAEKTCPGALKVIGSSAWEGWTPERSRCDNRSTVLRARLGPDRLLQIECFGHSYPAGLRVHLRTLNGHFVVAEGGGGRDLNATRTAARAWETFTLIDQNGGELTSGDKVNLVAFDGQHYVVAEGGGGREVAANRPHARNWESFTIRKVNGGDPIRFGDSVTLQAYNGNYVVAEGGGGGAVNADRPHARTWETFTLIKAF
jgi:hypothetical protein